SAWAVEKTKTLGQILVDQGGPEPYPVRPAEAAGREKWLDHHFSYRDYFHGLGMAYTQDDEDNLLLPTWGPFLPPGLRLLWLAPFLVQLDDPVEGLGNPLGRRIFRLAQPLVAGQEERLGLGKLLLPGETAAQHTLGAGDLPVAGWEFFLP